MDTTSVGNRITISTGGTTDGPPPLPSRDKKTSKRRFPGPAGLLPSLRPNEFLHVDGVKGVGGKKNPISEKIDNIISSEKGSSVAAAASKTVRQQSLLTQQVSSQSQSDCSLFEESTWQTLLSQLDLSTNEHSPNSFMSLMNLQWITKRAVKLQLPPCINIPFLLVMLQETNEFPVKSGLSKTGNPNVTLVDPTGTFFFTPARMVLLLYSAGTIDAAIDPIFLESYGHELNVGTSLALKNVGVFQHKRNATLIITEDNLICMTSKSNEDGQQHPSEEAHPRPHVSRNFVTEDNVRVTHFCDFKADEILKDLHFINLPDLDGGEDEDDDDESQEDEDATYQGASILESNTAAAARPVPMFTTNSERVGIGNQRNKFSFQWKSDLSQSLDRNLKLPSPAIVPQFKSPQLVAAYPIPKTSTSNNNTTGDRSFGDDEEDDDEFFRLLQTEDHQQTSASNNNTTNVDDNLFGDEEDDDDEFFRLLQTEDKTSNSHNDKDNTNLDTSTSFGDEEDDEFFRLLQTEDESRGGANEIQDPPVSFEKVADPKRV